MQRTSKIFAKIRVTRAARLVVIFQPMISLFCDVVVAVAVVVSLSAYRPFAANDHVVQNPPCGRASSLLFPHWDIKTKASQASLVQASLF